MASTFTVQTPSTALVKLDQSVWNDYLEAQAGRLPALPPAERISDRVVRVLGGNAGLMRLQGTNTYLLGTGQSRLLIDTGQGEKFWIDQLKKVLEAEGIIISQVLLTHWHKDHTGGVPDLLAHQPSVSDHIHKCDPDGTQQPIEDGQVFWVEGATVRAVFTPGHSHDHMCFVLDEEGALFTGDNVLGHGQSVFEDLGLFTRSLATMANLGCRVGYPAHGDVIRDLPAKMRDVISQREAHERRLYQTLRALSSAAMGSKPENASVKGNNDDSRSDDVSSSRGSGRRGSVTVPDLVGTLYGIVTSDVYRLAIEPSVVAMLKKLAEDRKAGFEMVDGEKRWFARERRLRPPMAEKLGNKSKLRRATIGAT